MTLVRFESTQHYDMICSWWKTHGWPVVVELDHLPGGYLVEHDGRPVCAGFLYVTGTAMAHFEWIVTNPYSGLKERSDALDVLISGIKLIAKSLGIRTIFCSLKRESLIDRMINGHGFIAAEPGATNLLGKV